MIGRIDPPRAQEESEYDRGQPEHDVVETLPKAGRAIREPQPVDAEMDRSP
jgi:hypothetical protein